MFRATNRARVAARGVAPRPAAFHLRLMRRSAAQLRASVDVTVAFQWGAESPCKHLTI